MDVSVDFFVVVPVRDWKGFFLQWVEEEGGSCTSVIFSAGCQKAEVPSKLPSFDLRRRNGGGAHAEMHAYRGVS